MSEVLSQSAGDSQSAGAELFAAERVAGLVPVPVVSAYRDILRVIDARERSLENIKTFLASMCFIRGNARSLPAGVLRQGRSKLSRLLARYRAHSTIVVELIQKWRQRHEPALPALSGAAAEGSAAGSAAGSVVGSAQGSARASSPSRRGSPWVAEANPLAASTYGQRGDGEGANHRRAVSSTMASAIATAAKVGPPPAPRQRVIEEPTHAEPFLWMGCNYLLKMREDLRCARGILLLHPSPLPYSRLPC